MEVSVGGRVDQFEIVRFTAVVLPILGYCHPRRLRDKYEQGKENLSEALRAKQEF
jgi:hypothetical protein